MRFEQATIALEPRTIGNCFDLAVAFCGRQLGPLLRLWAIFAVPTAGLVYFVCRESELGFSLAAAMAFLVSGPYGVMLVDGAAASVFGEPFTLRQVNQQLQHGGWGTAARVLLMRPAIAVGLACCIVPGVLLGVQFGFLAEKRALAHLHQQRHDRRTEELVRLEFGDLVLRGMLMFACGLGFWVVLFLTVDVASHLLFGVPIYLGRLAELSRGEYAEFGELVWFTWSDPLVLSVATATALLIYPICRLAWFFGYIDLRVRRDCWDLELEFLQEAGRLEREA